jgi:hypothetical protein
MIAYREQVQGALKNNKQKPQIPSYIGHCILMIAMRLSYKPNFSNYSYREEMVCDGVENCVSYIDNFDPNKSNSPFAYFTQIIYFAFLRRIFREKKQLYIKHKFTENSSLFNTLNEHNDFDDNDFYSSPQNDIDNSNMNEFIKSFEINLEKKKNKRKKGLEEFIEGGVLEDSDSY